jgi:hypothetical protein
MNKNSDFNKHNQDFLEIVQFAIKAPSGHNAQPWKFKMNYPALIAASLALLLASCNWEAGAFKRIDYDLHGTWECTEADFWTGVKSSLVLDYDTVTITGRVEHLRDFTRGIALEAYTEDGKEGEVSLLHIRDRGIWQSPVSYRSWQSGGYPKVEMLTLTGGSFADETFRKVDK